MIRSRRVAGLLLAVYVAVGALIVFWPSGDVASGSVVAIWDAVHEMGAPAWVSPHKIELGTNILLFVPLGFLGPTFKPQWRWAQWLLAGLAVSATIELTQLVFISARFADVTDVLSNTLGAVAGYLAAVVLQGRRR